MEPRSGVLVVHLGGIVTREDCTAAISAIVSDDTLPRPFRELADFRDVARVEADFRGVVELRDRVLSLGGEPVQLAMLADSDAVFAACRQLELLLDGSFVNARTFRALAAAAEWLSAEVPDLEAVLRHLRTASGAEHPVRPLASSSAPV